MPPPNWGFDEPTICADANPAAAYDIGSVNVNLGDARDKLSQLVQNVLDGEEITIWRNGEPVVDMVRTRSGRHSGPKFGTMRNRIIVKDPNWHRGPETDEELAAWLKGELGACASGTPNKYLNNR
jgi:antitoxin (DNA-binding transcriptional repressor) of toxin-antitoxin stability system